MLARYPLRSLTLIAAAAGVLGASGAAHANDTSFFDMPAMPYGQRIVGAELMLGSLERLTDITVIGLEGSVQWSLSDELVLTGILSLVTADSSFVDGSSLGNLTAGLTYGLSQNRTASGMSGFALDVSLSVPTSDDDGDGGAAAGIWGYFYVPDRGRYLPDTTTLRVAGEYRMVTGRAALQLELGLQQLVVEDFDDVTLVRLGAGAGFVASPRVFMLAEIMTVSDLLDDNDDGEDFLHTLNLGARIRAGNGNLGVRLYLPLDTSLRNDDIAGVGVQYQAYFH